MSATHAVRLAGVSVLVLIANVAVSVLYMVIYSYFIDPGHEAPYYESHIQFAAPYCSIVAGVPLMFFAGWWVTGWRPERALGLKSAFFVWLTYAVIDLSILLAAGMTSRIRVLFIVSFTTKSIATYCGSRIRQDRRGSL